MSRPVELEENRLLYLRIALIVFGLTFIFGIYPWVSSGPPVGLGGKGINTI
jgi:hypothetical protein